MAKKQEDNKFFSAVSDSLGHCLKMQIWQTNHENNNKKTKVNNYAKQQQSVYTFNWAEKKRWHLRSRFQCEVYPVN